MFRIRIRLDPLHGQPDPGNKKSAKIMENLHKKLIKITRISCIFSKILIFCLGDINIYLIKIKRNHFLEKYIFDRKKSKNNVGIFLILGRIWSRIRIRIKMNRIQNTGFSEPLSRSSADNTMIIDQDDELFSFHCTRLCF